MGYWATSQLVHLLDEMNLLRIQQKVRGKACASFVDAGRIARSANINVRRLHSSYHSKGQHRKKSLKQIYVFSIYADKITTASDGSSCYWGHVSSILNMTLQSYQIRCCESTNLQNVP